eukprot:CAMPEP_0201560562 /NCGR_PEP_ID=MMETSP0173_2-20130828/78334_1 /ASSEMBLY_ACC=CAM_ASM_000268 /TAXON_ID=218659 /ORGANISM="Vexillifera sp., Strain DIVA3 564/2" /LENGTH=46 /DNA_ID= /DNA_START= /DNA_END= /DNA_ORIENTATION=
MGQYSSDHDYDEMIDSDYHHHDIFCVHDYDEMIDSDYHHHDIFELS